MNSTSERPLLSVILPVRDGEHFLTASLAALRASDLPSSQWELILVDDSSQDRSAELADRYADQVIRLTGGPRGPAFARNRGADVARGDLLVFVDADVCVHPDALRRFAETFEADPGISAVFGAYDFTPTAGGLVSQYRNLLHRFVHQRDAGDAVTFWAGCGAVRASAFAICGGFDESEDLVCSVEDIELGYRLSSLGHRILLQPNIQGKHIKRWTLRSMIVTDVQHRGIPWMRLLLSSKVKPAATLNLRPSEQLCTCLVVLGTLALAAWLLSAQKIWLALAVAAVTVTLAVNWPLLAWFARHRGWGFALRAAPLRFLYYWLNAVSVSLALLTFAFSGQQPRSRMSRVQPLDPTRLRARGGG